MLDLARADPERQRSEGTVGGGVAVTADDRHPRLRDPQFGADDMDDPLVGVAKVEQANPELPAIRPERVDLLLRDRVGDREAAIGGGDVVIGRRERCLGASHAATGDPQPLEGLGTGDLVNEVPIDVDQRLFAVRAADEMVVPDLVEKRARSGHGGVDGGAGGRSVGPDGPGAGRPHPQCSRR